MPPGLLATLLALAVVLPADLWVLLDARALARRDDPVVLSVGSLTLEEPLQWAVACVVLFVVFFPAYLVSRRAR